MLLRRIILPSASPQFGIWEYIVPNPSRVLTATTLLLTALSFAACGSSSSGSSSPGASPSASQAAAPAKVPPTLFDFKGSGTNTTQKFHAPGGPDGGVFLLNYTYDCTSLGKPGSIQVQAYWADGSVAAGAISGSDTLIYRTDPAKSGGNSEPIHAGDKGGDLYLTVDSECSWHLWGT
jgi:hypothetical protein